MPRIISFADPQLLRAVDPAGPPVQFNYDWFVPNDSDVKAAMRVRDEHFGGMYLPTYLYTKEADYSAQHEAFQSMTDAFQAVPGVLPSSVDSWYNAFVRNRTAGPAPSGMPDTSEAFHLALRAWLGGAGAQYAPSVKFDASGGGPL